MAIVYWVCNFFLCVLKLRIICFGIIGLERKHRKLVQFLYPALLIVIVVMASIDATRFDTRLSYLCPFGVALLVALELKRFRQAVFVLLAIFAATLFDVISAITICGITTVSLPELYLTYGLRLLAEAIPVTLLFMVQGVIKRKDKGQAFKTLGREYLLAFAIMVGIHAILLIVIPNGFFVDPQVYGGQIFYALMFNCVVFLAAVALYSINLVKRRQSEMDRNQYMQMYVQQRDYFGVLLQNNRETHSMRHDMLTHLHCIHSHVSRDDTDAAMAYLNRLLDDSKKIQTGYKTGNMVLDTVLNKAVEYPEGVELAIKGAVPNELTVSDADLCVIFSNLLSNAVFAAGEHDNKTVYVEFRWLNNHLYCSIANYTVNVVHMKRGYPALPTADGHGYGVPNAIRAAELNEGTIEFKQNGEYFVAEVILQNAKK